LQVGLDLLDRMLTFNPGKRITVEEALKHPYLASLHCEEDEPVCPSTFNFDFENYPLTKRNLQLLMFEQIARYHPEVMDREKRAGSWTDLGPPPAKPHPAPVTSGTTDE
jgi:serine/threonine protein kinase